MSKALLIIDYVVDFVADDGKLTCGAPGQAIDGNIAAAVERFAQEGGFIVVASDYHAQGDTFSPEHKMFPPHCVVDTEGRALYGKTRAAVETVAQGQLLALDKCRYSAFAGTNLDIKLRERGVTDVYLTGVCTDICVLHTAVDAYNLGYNIFILENGVASFNAEGHAFALSHFKNTLGAAIV